MTDFAKTKRTTLKRYPDRGRFDRETVYAILDEALYCHVAFLEDGRPVVIPTGFWRSDDHLYMHGSSASRLIRALQSEIEVSVAVTLVDGLVLARSGFHSSVNYRSVVVFGRSEAVVDKAAKLKALHDFIERVTPGRWDELRPPTDNEIKGTGVARVPLAEVSAKVRGHGVVDDEEDYGHPVWAGVLPLALASGAPVPDARLLPGIEAPAYLPGPGPFTLRR